MSKPDATIHSINSKTCASGHGKAKHHDHNHVHSHGGDHIPSDKLGIALSFICLIHCLLGPIIILFLPSLAESIGHEMFHWIILVGIVPIALFSFIKSYKSHRVKFPLQLGSFGILLLLLGILIPELIGHGHTEPMSFESLETAFTVLGGVCLAYAHYYNLKQCQCRE